MKELEALKARNGKKLTAYAYDHERAEAGEKKYTLTSGDLGRVAELIESARFMGWDDIIPECFKNCNPATMTVKIRKR